VKKTNSFACLLVFILAISFTTFSLAVEATPTLNLNFYKNNGYGMGNDMNGEWTINTDVSSDVQYVEFYLDDQMQLNDTNAPFSWNFNTGSYSEGEHTIKVVAYDALGETATADRQANFVGFPLTFVVTLIVVVVVTVIASFGFALYRARKTEKMRKKH
jgi:ABC-type sugar transport system permease subunit